MRRAIHRIRGLSLAVKLSAVVLVSVAVIFVGAFEYNYRMSRQIILKNVELAAQNLTQATAGSITALLAPLETLVHYVSMDIEQRSSSAEQLEHLVSQTVSSNPAIYGAAIAFEPNSFDPASQYVMYYAHHDGEKVVVDQVGDATYDYHFMDWYIIPKLLAQPIWSEPYFDEGAGNITMATFSSPFFREADGQRPFWGINTIDISLEWLHEMVSKVTLYESGYAFIISENGVFLTHPAQDFIMRESIFSQAEEKANAAAREAGKNMVRGKTGFVKVDDFRTNAPSWLYYAPLASTGWSVGVIVPEATLFADIVALEKRVLLIIGACLVLLLLIIIALSMRITKPLRLLSRVTTEIARGNLDIELPPARGYDEVGKLSRSFEEMRVALKEYIADLTLTTAAKERIESELKIARHIQMSFLPRHFPSVSGSSEFQLHAFLEPAKEVGGDLYDFFLLDDDHLFISVGDVSGKGVPAALLMAVTKTLVKGVAEQGIDLADVLRKVNAELCQENDSMMFVTLFCAMINLRTGEMRYASAGHNPPLIVPVEGEPYWLEQPEGLVLGVKEDAVYEGKTAHLAPGDNFIGFTDGVTEAMNEAERFYGEHRLLLSAVEGAGMDAKELVAHLFATVREFVGTAPQSDDITVLVFKNLQKSEE